MINRTTDSPSHLLSVLSISSFRNLWFAQLISQIAFNMFTFVLAVVIYEKTRSNAAVSSLYFVVGVPATIFGLFSGVYVDRFNKRRLLLVTTLVRAGLLVCLFFFRTLLIPVYILTALMSFLTQFFLPAQAALIPQYIPKQLLMSANSLFILTFYSAYVGGYVFGGPILAAIGAQTLILSLSGLFMISTLFLFILPRRENQNFHKEQLSFIQFKDDLLGVFKYIQETIVVKQAIFLLTLAQALIAVFITLGPGFADRLLHIKITDASLIILGPAALGMILGGLFIGQIGERFRKRLLINTGIILSGLILVFLSLLVKAGDETDVIGFLGSFLAGLNRHVLPISVVSFFLLGVSNSLIDISCNTALQEQTSDKIRGRVYGILSTLISGVAILPVIVSGILADFFGINKIIFLLGVGMVVFGFYTTDWFNRLTVNNID